MSDATGEAGASYHPHPPFPTACAANAQMSGGTPRAAPNTAAMSCAVLALGPAVTCVIAGAPDAAAGNAAEYVTMGRPRSDANAMNTPARMIPVVRSMGPPNGVESRRAMARYAPRC
jgi:hypothetical protein